MPEFSTLLLLSSGARETRERFALRVGFAQLAGLRQRVITVDDALRRLDEVHHAGLALGEHGAARLDRAP